MFFVHGEIFCANRAKKEKLVFSYVIFLFFVLQILKFEQVSIQGMFGRTIFCILFS
jgi:hypothetical protein